MFSLIDPRIWGAVLLALVLASGASYWKGRHDGRQLERADTAAAVEKSNLEARKTEQLRQDRVDEAARTAAARERSLLADAAGARAAAGSLRDALDAREREAANSLSASNASLRLTSELLEACGLRYSDVAAEADRADSEARELREAWPK